MPYVEICILYIISVENVFYSIHVRFDDLFYLSKHDNQIQIKTHLHKLWYSLFWKNSFGMID